MFTYFQSNVYLLSTMFTYSVQCLPTSVQCLPTQSNVYLLQSNVYLLSPMFTYFSPMFTYSVQCLPTLLKLRFVLSPFVARLRLIIMVLDQSPPDQHPAEPATPAEPPNPAVGGPLTKAPECSKSGVVNGPFGVGSPPLPTSSLPTGLFLPLTLSPQTCCELLMSDKLSHQQLLRDADLIRTHYPDFALTKGKKNDPLKQLSKLKEAFKAHFDTATYKLADSLLSQSSVTNHPPPELTQEIVKLNFVHYW